MNYNKLSVAVWDMLDTTGDPATGYKSNLITGETDEKSVLYIFKDEDGYCHFAIEVLHSDTSGILNSDLNGLSVKYSRYRLAGQTPRSFIDICCRIPSFINEFTQVIKEISKNILETNKTPAEAVNQVINNWKSFWANQNKNILSEDKQIGLICELKVLECLLKINSVYALNSWVGPQGKQHDFNFTDWSLEVKGTRRSGHIHTINGLDQLKPMPGKRLSLLSFIVLNADNAKSTSLQQNIETIYTMFSREPALIIQFNKLLSLAGYSPLYVEEYRKFKIEILEAVLYSADESFPCLTNDKLAEPLNSRITSVRYDISLDGISGVDFQNITWGNYFY